MKGRQNWFPTMERVRVEIDTEKIVHIPGQIIKGTATIFSPKALEVDSVECRLHGEIDIRYVVKGEVFKNNRVLVDCCQELWHYSTLSEMLGMEEHDENYNDTSSRLCNGACFSFSFTLPDNLPTSFNYQSSPVVIKYHIEVNLKEADEVVCHREHQISVVAPSPIPRLAPSQDITHSKHYRLPKERSIFVECILDKSVFTPTDRINAKINIVNRWKQSIKYVHMNIVGRIEVEGSTRRNPTQSNTYVVNIDTAGVGLSTEKRKIEAGESFSFCPSFNLPALPPNISVEKLMKTDYLLKVAVGRAHNYILATLKIPITIVVEMGDIRQGADIKPNDVLIDISSSPFASFSSRKIAPLMVDLLA